MSKKIQLIIVSIFLSIFSFGQLRYIHTDKDNVLSQSYTQFVIVDKTTKLVLAKNPIKYNASAVMPTAYFSIDLPAGVTSYAPNARRLLVIHTLQATDEDWALENNKTENDVFFGRSRFVVNSIDKQWKLSVDGEHVIFQSLADGKYLQIDTKGDLKLVQGMAQASRWQLIHILNN